MKSKRLILSLLIITCAINDSLSQENRIVDVIQQGELKSDIFFLASDELKGRSIGSVEADITARYIAETFRGLGIAPVTTNEYLQVLTLTTTLYSNSSSLSIGNKRFQYGDHFVIRNGEASELSAPVIFIKSVDDFQEFNIKNFIIVTPYYPVPENKPKIRNELRQMGGLAWIELLHNERPYKMVRDASTKKFLTKEKAEQNVLPHLIVNDPANDVLNLIKEMKIAKINISIKVNYQKTITTSNVIGEIEGTDKKLRDQYVILSAHYDHIGTSSQAVGTDSIYNGARDNAIGTAAILAAAKYFSRHPPKRSLLLIGFAAEEGGLFGSAYYADNPLIPLKKCVYNLNIDNVGYNDTGKITMFGSGRTNIDTLVIRSARKFGLEAINDPIPKENFVERSDNASFMKKGIPAMQYAMGVTSMDDKINMYYHQLSDEASSLDMDYVYRYVCSYVLTSETLCNSNFIPYWAPGDKFEVIAKSLYSN